MKQTHARGNAKEPLQQKITLSKPQHAENEDKPLAKKTRLDHGSSVSNTHAEVTPSPLLRIPLELLAEILIHTKSPKYVLAVARTSKLFCNLLLDPSLAFVWRDVRRMCIPAPLPDPFSIFSEASYASFVFDGGYCEVSKILAMNSLAAID